MSADISDDDILASLANFTKQIDAASSTLYDEMRKCSFFDPVPGPSLQEISKEGELKKYAAGQHIVDQGDVINSFHVLLFGTATALVNNVAVGTIHSGECIGEGAFFGHENFTRSATVVADGEVLAVEIRKSVADKMEGEVRTHMDKALLLALFKKLQATNKYIENLVKKQSGGF
jgi:CRP-like cAMP-binding protein